MSDSETRHHVAHPVLEGDAFSAWMGIRLIEASAGHSVIEMTIREEHTNGFGIVHGGMVFAFADTAFAMACNDPAGDGSEVTVASGADVNFLRSGRPGETLRATGREIHKGRSGLYDIVVVLVAPDGSDGPVVAHFRGRSRTVPGKNVPHPRRD